MKDQVESGHQATLATSPVDTRATTLKSLTFKNGQTLSVPSRGVTVIVGPNNSGKTQTLKDISSLIASTHGPAVALEEIETFGALGRTEFLNLYGSRLKTEGNLVTVERYGIHSSTLDQALALGRGFEDLVRVVVPFLDTSSRLSLVNPPGNINHLRGEPLTHPIHALQMSDDLCDAVSQSFCEAFGVGLILNREDGARVSIHVSGPPPAELRDRSSIAYRRWLQAKPALHEQGDGMRSFAGSLLYAIAWRHSVLLLDEPEAFLHPPQSRALGRIIGKNTQRDGQLIVATHSVDFLRGLIDEASDGLKIVRVMRGGAGGRVDEIELPDIRQVWADPLIRASNALNALFFERTIVCEADSDSRFYGAMLDTLGGYSHNTLLVSANGKDKIPKVVRALRALGVDVAAIVDVDVLNRRDLMAEYVAAFGAEWTAFERDWKVVAEAVRQMKSPTSIADARRCVASCLEAATDESSREKLLEKIRSCLGPGGGWEQVKRSGVGALPQGEVANAAERLTSGLASIGMYVVKEGELECFDKTIGGHKATWIREVLDKDLRNAPELAEARSFVAQLLRPSATKVQNMTATPARQLPWHLSARLQLGRFWRRYGGLVTLGVAVLFLLNTCRGRR